MSNDGKLMANFALELSEKGSDWKQRALKAEADAARLKGTLTYIQAQAKSRPSGDKLTLSVIERNAAAALNDGFQAALKAAGAPKDRIEAFERENLDGKTFDEFKRGGVGSLVSTLVHNGRVWRVFRIGGSYFARDNATSDTGPYTTVKEAEDWIRAIQPVDQAAALSASDKTKES